MLMRLRAYFHLNDWRIYETANMKSIIEMCDDAATQKKFVAMAGYTGAGKTTALRSRAKKHASSWYVLGTTIATQRTFLTAILRAMGISEGNTVQDKMSLIVREMNSRPDALLIIDDAGKLTDNILRLIQSIYDETEHNAGIVIAGTQYLKTYITRGAAMDKRGFRELARRISYCQPMSVPAKREIEFVCRD
jgi:DNA transposition AAA+ family ATPase